MASHLKRVLLPRRDRLIGAGCSRSETVWCECRQREERKGHAEVLAFKQEIKPNKYCPWQPIVLAALKAKTERGLR